MFRSDLIEVFKIKKGFEDVDSRNFFIFSGFNQGSLSLYLNQDIIKCPLIQIFVPD